MNTNPKTDEVHERITSQIIASLEEGLIDPANWKAPWTAGADVFSPINVLTERAYTAGNRFILAINSMMTDTTPYWGTYNQWAAMTTHSQACRDERYIKPKDTYAKATTVRCAVLECEAVHVRKGEHAMETLLRPVFRKERNDAGLEVEKLVGFTAFKVFNSVQIEGWTPPPVETFEHPADVQEDCAAAFAWADVIGAEVREDSQGNRAAFAPKEDYIIMPSRDRWAEPDQLWSTMAHECTHWSGHPDRLDRHLLHAIVKGEQYERSDYAFEELIAELSAAFTLAALGRSTTPRDDHVEYIGGWLKILKEDNKAIWRAASKAQRASGYLLARHTANTAAKELANA